VGSAPLNVADTIWWVIAAGGNPIQRNQTGERFKNYTLDVYYRSTDAEAVYNTLQDFEQFINTASCDQLAGFDTIEMQATLFPTDQDLDADDRTVGLVQITITTYY
jgi:hypothetical protein